MNPNLIILLVLGDSNLFLLRVFIAFSLITILYFLFRFGLRRWRFKQRDLKAAGLNHQQRRQWLAERRRKKKKISKLHY